MSCSIARWYVHLLHRSQLRAGLVHSFREMRFGGLFEEGSSAEVLIRDQQGRLRRFWWLRLARDEEAKVSLLNSATSEGRPCFTEMTRPAGLNEELPVRHASHEPHMPLFPEGRLPSERNLALQSKYYAALYKSLFTTVCYGRHALYHGRI